MRDENHPSLWRQVRSHRALGMRHILHKNMRSVASMANLCDAARTVPSGIQGMVAIPARLSGRPNNPLGRHTSSNSRIPLAILIFAICVDDVPTSKKVFCRYRTPERHYLTLAHWPSFRARTKSDPVSESVEAWPARSEWAIAGNTPPR